MQRRKQKASDNSGHKIMKRLKRSVYVRLATSKVVLDIYYMKNCIRIDLRVTKWLKT